MLARLVGALRMLATVKALEAIGADAPSRVGVLDAAGAVAANAPLAQLRTFACGAWSGCAQAGASDKYESGAHTNTPHAYQPDSFVWKFRIE